MSTITFKCVACQQVLKVGADKAGRKAKCLKCGTIVTIPGADAGEAPENTPSGPSRSSGSKGPSLARRDELEADPQIPRRRRDQEEADEEDRPRRRRDREYDDDEEDRPRRRRDREYDDDEEDRPRRRRDREYDDDEEDRPRRRRDREYDDDEEDRPKKGKASWPKVRVGLLLVLIGSCIFLAALALDLLGKGITFINLLDTMPSLEAWNVARVIQKIGMAVLMLAMLTAIGGFVFWLFANNKKGAQAFAITTLCLASINLLIFIIFRFIPLFDRGLEAGALGIFPVLQRSFGLSLVLTIAIMLLEAAVWIMASLYLLALGQTHKDRSLSGRAKILLTWSGITGAYRTILPVVLMIITHNARNLGKGFFITGLLLDMVGLGLACALFVILLLTVKEGRGTLES